MSFSGKGSEKYARKLDYYRTYGGWLTKVYRQQVSSSKVRNMSLPSYTQDELSSFIDTQSNFAELWTNWQINNYDTMLIPSIDRLEDDKPYTIDNIRICTWQENKEKYMAKKPIIALYEGDEIMYDSIQEAAIDLGLPSGNISQVCRGVRKTCGGYTFKFQGANNA